MEKKDIYEHLAKIYLDVSSQKKKKSNTKRNAYKKVVFASVFFIFALSFVLFISSPRKNAFNSEIALVLAPDPVKINFHFNPAKKETYTINLNNLDLDRFKALAFSVKKTNYKDSISLRIEFINAFKEKSEIYLKDIPASWRDFKINFSEFKNISDWSDMASLIVAVEEWNTREKKGVVYVDNIRLLKGGG